MWVYKVIRDRGGDAGLGFLIVLAAQLSAGAIIIDIIFIVVNVIVVVLRLPRLQHGTPADQSGADHVTQSDVVDHDDAEMQTRLDDQQKVGIDVQIAEEDDGRSVDEVVDEREYFEGENDQLESGADEIHVTDD